MIARETSPLTYAEAEKVAAQLAPRWIGMTGQPGAPCEFQIADIVQFVLRAAAVVIAERDGAGQ